MEIEEDGSAKARCRKSETVLGSGREAKRSSGSDSPDESGPGKTDAIENVSTAGISETSPTKWLQNVASN